MKPYVRHLHDEEDAFKLINFQIDGLAKKYKHEVFVVYLIHNDPSTWEFNILGFGSESQIPRTTKLFLAKELKYTELRVATDNEVLDEAR
jgi:hypothetical protein